MDREAICFATKSLHLGFENAQPFFEASNPWSPRSEIMTAWIGPWRISADQRCKMSTPLSRQALLHKRPHRIPWAPKLTGTRSKLNSELASAAGDWLALLRVVVGNTEGQWRGSNGCGLLTSQGWRAAMPGPAHCTLVSLLRERRWWRGSETGVQMQSR